MSPGRRHPLSRREDEDLAAALAASSRETTSLSTDKDDALAPTASLAALPKFGSIHGTLGSTIPQPPDLQHPTQPIARSSSDERLAIASSFASVAPHTAAAGQAARVLVADTPIASATGRTSASDPIVTASTSTDSSLSAAARRATMATEGISSFSSEGRLGGRNNLTVPGAALNLLGMFGKLPPLPGGAQEDEVVGDSDGEGGGQSLPPLPPAAKSDAQFVKAPSSSSAIVTGSSSSAHTTSAAALLRQSTTSIDPIVSTSTGPSAQQTAPRAAASLQRNRHSTFSVEIPARGSSKSITTVAKGKKRALEPEVQDDAVGEKKDEDEEEADDDAGETDYDTMPSRKKEKDKATGRKERRKVRRQIAQSDPDDDDAAPDMRSSPDPLALSSASAQHGGGASGSNKRARSPSGSELGSPAPAPARKKSASNTSRRRTLEPAQSEDEDGQQQLADQVRAAQLRAEEDDEDFGAAPKRKGKKGAAAVKGRKRSVAGDGEEMKDKVKKPRRVPTVKKDGSAPPPSVDEAGPSAPQGDATEATSALEAQPPFEEDAAVTKPKRSRKKKQSQPLVPPLGDAPAQASGGVDTLAAFAEPVEEDDDKVVLAKAKPKPQAKKGVVLDSDDEDAAGQPGAAVDDAASFDPEPAAVAAAPSKKRRQRKSIVMPRDFDPDVEGGAELNAGAVSDATSAIATGDEFSDDEEDERPAKRGKKAAARAKKGKEKKTSPARSRKKAPSAAAVKPDSSSRAGKSASPAISRARTTSKEVEDRMQKVMNAASEEPDEAIWSLQGKSVEKGKGKARAKIGGDADDEEDEEDDEPEPEPSGSSDTKENDKQAAPAKGPRASTSGRDRVKSATPFSKAPKPGSLASIISRHNLANFRAPGLSFRQKLPSLHTNLKPPPPPKRALPAEKPKKKKKGDESYSDEEKPWWKVKDPEEWDDSDHQRWQKRQRRLERGLPSDSGED
ncbi:hypothetical protein Rhopal_001630-T1 [Rhodotorula paludigena]|uniref:Proteophosphoglycan ppg4 n=1 Tax=Rhodotorula paludigena TaxID=86838 RepID=A0AAV5GFK5_9BASI|nr:hypothetical protein Rhopal_001630-T1 [Rhodotorula paludigena]